jgi:predicted DNA-binding transcriptional regulator AlpA
MKETKTKLPRGRWLEPREQAEMIGVSLSWIYSTMRKRTLPWPVYSIGPKRLADSEDIQEWLIKVKIPAGGEN